MHDEPLATPALLRPLWFAGGLTCVALGFLGAVLPLMPSTVFFVLAAACFSRSSPRFLRWLLNLPLVGPLVRDYRAGLGMPFKAKITAVVMITVAVAWSAWRFIPVPAGQVAWVMVGAVGVWFILRRVPTRHKQP